jgi:uncharacterized repeat protein (TIGR03803 family)
VTILLTFPKTQGPTQPLLYYKGRLIGVLGSAGPRKHGAIFALKETAAGTWKRPFWHVFEGGTTDGSAPEGSLILGSDGNLYGTTEFGGGAQLGNGTVYKLDPTTHQLTIVADFPGPSPANCPNTALLQGADGNFYGGTLGFVPGGMFMVTPGGQFTLIYSFSGNTFLAGPLIQASDGNFYGVTAGGGASDAGYVFQMTPASYVVTILHSFGQGQDGAGPGGGLVEGPNGYLYGSTSIGGTGHSGTIYQMVRKAWESAVQAPQAELTTWIHGDLHPQNVLVADGELRGVIDWADIAAGDCATDLASIWMLLPSVVARESAIAEYGSVPNATWSRALGWAVNLGTVLLETGLVNNPRHCYDR